MPAIDVAQVRFEAAELAPQYADPEAFAAATREFFETHSAPILRQSSIVSISAPLKAYGTPLPILRLLLGALRKPATADLQRTILAVKHLWADPIREQRHLAVELLGVVTAAAPDQAAALMRLWLINLDDLELIDLLADRVAAPWLLANLRERLAEARQWVNSPHKYQRRFGVAALGALAKERNFEDVASALAALNTVMRESDLEVRKSVAHVLRDLSAHGPGEVARFLIEWADTIDKNTHWIVRHAVDKLDADARDRVLAILRGKG